MKLAIIGCGNIVIKEHIPAIDSLGVKIYGVCDLLQENINNVRNLLNYYVPSFLSYKELISLIKPDTVVIALPHAMYYEVLSYCSNFPMKVIKEKPFALTLSQSKIFSDLSRDRDFKILTVCQKRYTLAYEILKNKIYETQEKIFQIDIRYTIPSRNPNGRWRSQFSTSGGGVWLDMGHHVVDIINYLFNGKEIKINHARLINSSNGEYNVDDIAFVELECDKVIIIAYISCVALQKHEDITVYGQNKIFYANKKKVVVKNKKQEIIYAIKVKDISSFSRMYKEFLFEGGEAGFERNLNSSISLMRVLEKAFESSKYNKLTD
ncbi:Gfo/Idh/MocA family protein [Pantoea sp. Nvir]|uniref:Gfo/Idh/MocA family protein n=1 Tax=Pantoea sp. Nvir TaxID=2576760 RepID=UPI00135752C3|nr:Gfo/Idh/MocA family oxidoreductase [Pantoea sp. Nvir]MXP67111.1 Gfo/Idh/MocA family oxidoreductase [Pantoea sp. Nvir]CAJ0993613.1 Inositol 2-dehydrogenase/D-chiro-inositol 3-dehydrogenase [Pantoea sp. Nvir]